MEHENRWGYTPLMNLCFKGFQNSSEAEKCKLQRLKILRALLLAGADANKCRKDTKLTPLHWTAYNEDEKSTL